MQWRGGCCNSLDPSVGWAVSFWWERAMPVKDSAPKCEPCSQAWPAPTGSGFADVHMILQRAVGSLWERAMPVKDSAPKCEPCSHAWLAPTESAFASVDKAGFDGYSFGVFFFCS